MRIAAVRTYLTFGGWRNWVFVQVETDEGLTGLRESARQADGVLDSYDDLGAFLRVLEGG